MCFTKTQIRWSAWSTLSVNIYDMTTNNKTFSKPPRHFLLNALPDDTQTWIITSALCYLSMNHAWCDDVRYEAIACSAADITAIVSSKNSSINNTVLFISKIRQSRLNDEGCSNDSNRPCTSLLVRRSQLMLTRHSECGDDNAAQCYQWRQAGHPETAGACCTAQPPGMHSTGQPHADPCRQLARYDYQTVSNKLSSFSCQVFSRNSAANSNTHWEIICQVSRSRSKSRSHILLKSGYLKHKNKNWTSTVVLFMYK